MLPEKSTYVVSTRRGSTSYTDANAQVKGIDQIIWSDGIAYLNEEPVERATTQQYPDAFFGVEARLFPTEHEAEIAAVKKLLEAGKEILKATGYELTGIFAAGETSQDTSRYIGYATAIFYKTIKKIKSK